jgi:hypothetical protein
VNETIAPLVRALVLVLEGLVLAKLHTCPALFSEQFYFLLNLTVHLLYIYYLRENISNCQIAFKSTIGSNDRPRWVIKHPKRVWLSEPSKQRYRLITVFILLYYYTDIYSVCSLYMIWSDLTQVCSINMVLSLD